MDWPAITSIDVNGRCVTLNNMENISGLIRALLFCSSSAVVVNIIIIVVIDDPFIGTLDSTDEALQLMKYQ